MNDPARPKPSLAAVLALASLGALPTAAPGAETPGDRGHGAAYAELGRLPLMHSGRKKPLDTVARQEVKIINGRQSFELADDKGKPIGKWEAAAAFFGWSTDPDFWDDQRFILVEYVPLKEVLMAGRARALLAAIKTDDKIDDPRTLGQIDSLLDADRISGAALREIARNGGLSKERQDEVEALAHRLDGGDKFCSPRELEEAQIRLDGRTLTFEQWFRDAAMKSRPMANGGNPAKLSALEEKVVEVHNRLARYQRIRGDENLEFLPAVDHAIPRPANEAYLGFIAATVKKYEALKSKPENADKAFPVLDLVRRDKRDDVVYVETAAGRDLPVESLEMILAMPELGFNALECDAIGTLVRHWADLQRDDRKLPGTDSKADEALLIWLREDGDWAPIGLLSKSEPADLSAAGYPNGEVEPFRQALDAARESERNEAGKLDRSAAEKLVASARALAEAVNDYPTAAIVGREVGYNRFAPFYKAPIFYGIGAVLLGLSLTFRPAAGSALALLRKGMVAVGMAGFVGGMGLEVYGFYQRVTISGWAPVTNMYETVIWVALVSAAIGLVLEAIYRKVYAAAAASAVAALCTLIAANAASVLNPNIESLQPVLRSNYWLAIHVLTIVSSYAAFALAMGLGTIALWSYLTATYRRDVSYRDLGAFLIPGIPAAVAGVIIAYLPSFGVKLAEPNATTAFYAGWILAVPGIVGVVMSLTAMLGEAVSRASFARFEHRLATQPPTPAEVPATPVDPARAKFAAGRVELSTREKSMQEAAGRIKPLASFVYRALQVGVLLVAAGTILGGVWADYSWGRFWGWDPKEVSALITLLAYLIPLHGRFAGWINTFGLVCASVFCFNFVLIAWYGVNFLLGVGLHSYGFAEGGNQGTVLLSTLAANAMVGGTIWRRSLAQRTIPVEAVSA